MGLDNNLAIRGKTFESKKWLADWAHSHNLDNFYDGFEIGYWRKCWNIRDKFASTFRTFEDGGDTVLTVDQLIDVRLIMAYFLKEENWEEYGRGSIWTWSESIGGIANVIFLIDRFYEDMMMDGLDRRDFEVIFADSY